MAGSLLLLLTSSALGYISEPDRCATNLVFVGTVVSRQGFYHFPPEVNPQHPEGRIHTKVTLLLDRVVLDATGATEAGQIDIAISGGEIETTVMIVPEMPVMDIGDRYAVAASIVPGLQFPLLVAWEYINPETELPTETRLRKEWESFCAKKWFDPLLPPPTHWLRCWKGPNSSLCARYRLVG